MTTADFRNGMFMRREGQIYELVYFQHVKPGKGGAFVRTKLKSLQSGNVREVTFRSGEEIESVYYQEKEASFLYQQNDFFCFMDQESYEQIEVPQEQVTEIQDFLKEGEAVSLIFCDGNLLKIQLKPFVVLAVKETDPGLKGDTASGGNKPATLETGAVIQVPLFVKTGDKIKIDTRSKSYLGRE